MKAIDLITHLLNEFKHDLGVQVKFDTSNIKGHPFTDAEEKHFKNTNGFCLINVKFLKEVRNESNEI